MSLVRSTRLLISRYLEAFPNGINLLKTLVIFDAGNYKDLEEFGLGDVIMNQLKIKLMIVIP